jgi:hypothetical protein
MPATAIAAKLFSDATHPIVDKNGVMTEDFAKYLMQLSNTFILLTGDTTAGNLTQPLPAATSLPNQEVFAIKISSDGNTFSLSAQGSDKINKQGAWGAAALTVGTAQGAAVRLKSDGNSNWYVV